MIVVIGCGRSGTNIFLELLRGSSKLKASKNVEDKKVFKRKKRYNKDYLTKCDIIYFTFEDLKSTIKLNPSIKLIWTWRNPKDMCLSKMRRGVPKEKGGDCISYSTDSTPKGCTSNIRYGYKFYNKIRNAYPDLIYTVKMEDALLNIEDETKSLCKFLEISYEEKMLSFHRRMRNRFKRKRYKTIDKSQINLWKNWKTVYNGYFTKNNIDMENIFKEVEDITKKLGYSYD